MTEPKIYILDEKEVHMMGAYVGVVWNTTMQKKTLKGEDGVTYRAEVPVRSGEPYIDFISIREDAEGEPYEDEDSPVQGGFKEAGAIQIRVELAAAIEYLKKVSKEGK